MHVKKKSVNLKMLQCRFTVIKWCCLEYLLSLKAVEGIISKYKRIYKMAA